jgi:predicted TIM-barrel fold metal-dependent hydrolase
MLQQMGEGAVETSIISISDPGVHFGDNAAARALARECNEFAARVVSDHPGRFGFFAVLPLPDVDGALREAEYALDTLKADGIGVLFSYAGNYLGNPAFAPLMDECNRRKAVVYCHPYCAACGVQTTLTDAQSRGVEFVFDTTRTILSLLQTATVARCPDITFIWSHGGGTVPFITSRLAGAARNLPNGLMYELQRFYYDTAQAFKLIRTHCRRSRGWCRFRRSCSGPTIRSAAVQQPSSRKGSSTTADSPRTSCGPSIARTRCACYRA